MLNAYYRISNVQSKICFITKFYTSRKKRVHVERFSLELKLELMTRIVHRCTEIIRCALFDEPLGDAGSDEALA